MRVTKEAPIDPKRRIIDAHHHLWDVGDGHANRTEAFFFEDMVKETADHHVLATVYLQIGAGYRKDGPEAMRPVGETEFAAAQALRAQGSPRLAAIVSWADMTLGDAAEDVFAAHEVAGNGLFRGIRFATIYDPNFQHGPARRPGLLRENSVRRALMALGRHGYSFDAYVYHPQLIELADAVRAVEETTFVINHLGGPLACPPYNRSKAQDAWRFGMRELAACPNVFVKLGGIGMESLFGTAWAARDEPPASDEVVHRWRDEISWCVDTFGPERCMFASNFPPDRRAIPYTVLWNAFKKIASSYSDAEQDQLFAGTAARVYRIALSE